MMRRRVLVIAALACIMFVVSCGGSPTATPVPTKAVVVPTTAPTAVPATKAPAAVPTTAPTTAPTAVPATKAPTTAATTVPTTAPTAVPATKAPTTAATTAPTTAPTAVPATKAPTTAPTAAPAAAGTSQPGTFGKADLDKIFPPGRGQDLVFEACNNCHPWVPIVFVQDGPARWEQIMFDHKDRIGLNDADYRLLTDYLAKNFPPDRKPPENIPPDLLTQWTSY